VLRACVEGMALRLSEVSDAGSFALDKTPHSPRFILGKPSPEWDALGRSDLSAGALAVLGAAASLRSGCENSTIGCLTTAKWVGNS